MAMMPTSSTSPVTSLPVGHVSEVGALGGPHGRRPHPEQEGGGEERVELGIELGPDVGRVAHDTQHNGPLDLQVQGVH